MSQITISEYLMGRGKLEELPEFLQENVANTVYCVNRLLTRFGQSRSITSGLRTVEDQKRIYAQINESRIKNNLPLIPAPMRSKHISGMACDISDADGCLLDFCKDSEDILENIGLWCEERQGGWLHVQTVAYGSWEPGKTRFFRPF